jgi:hypothetical protein
LIIGVSQPCITGTHNGPLSVPTGHSLCLGAGAYQNGPVTIASGGALTTH